MEGPSITEPCGPEFLHERHCKAGDKDDGPLDRPFRSINDRRD
jgi:hypothetical protein